MRGGDLKKNWWCVSGTHPQHFREATYCLNVKYPPIYCIIAHCQKVQLPG